MGVAGTSLEGSPAATGHLELDVCPTAVPQPWPIIRAGGFQRRQAAKHSLRQPQTCSVNR